MCFVSFGRLPIWDYENGRWCVSSGGIGHQRSFVFITEGHLMKKCELNLSPGFCLVLLRIYIFMGVWKMDARGLPVVKEVT